MSNSMTAGDDVIQMFKVAYPANLPVLLDAPHGYGKSQLVKQGAQALGIGCIVIDLSIMEPTDLTGLPVTKGDRTIFLPPAFLPRDGNGLLVFEELNRAEKHMTSPCLQLLTTRRLNEYKLPDGWLPVACINPSSGEYDVNELDAALRSRFLHLKLKASPTEWLKWADSNGVHATVRRYVKDVRDVFDSSNPRSWTYVSDMLKSYEKSGIVNEPFLAKLVNGYVSDTHTTAFLATYRGAPANIPNADEILRNYKMEGISIRVWKKEKNTANLNACAHVMRTALQRSDLCAEIAGNQVMKTALADFINDLPADLAKQVRADAKAKGAMK